jgi:hypothetical protein
MPPGQAKKPTSPLPAEVGTATATPPGLANKAGGLPPGQAKKN